MPTAQQITDRALALIEVKTAGIAPTDAETSDAIRVMNAIIAEWQASGLNVGGTQAVVAGDETFVSDWAQEALSYTVGARIAPEYGKALSALFQIERTAAMDVVTQRGVSLPEAQFPTTMPVGAGNRWGGLLSPAFFVDAGSHDLTDERGNSLQTERGCILFLDTIEECNA